jgi:hypothetical protein
MKKRPALGTRVVISVDCGYVHKYLQAGNTGVVVSHYRENVVGISIDNWEYSGEWAFTLSEIEVLPLRQRFLNFWRKK